MVSHALNVNLKACGCGYIMHDTDLDALFLQHLSLLDVQLAKGSVAAWCDNRVTGSLRIAAPLPQRFFEANIVLFITLVKLSYRRCSSEQLATHGSEAKTARLLSAENQHLDAAS